MLNHDLTDEKNTKQYVKDIINNPFIELLLNKSNLTKIQLETLLIDILLDDISQNQNLNELKAQIRLKGPISRGSFNRTLKQAKNNILKSIITIVLLQYLNILEKGSLNSFIEISNRLNSYIETYKNDIQNSGKKLNIEKINIIKNSLLSITESVN
jgi:hypothetical protein